ncbi:MAG: leucine-rich repeat domain-containing protein [Clostridiales bacterium]|nr:leucine-rich repeat domain-containing protein [Clostridiales bacterium]
MKSLKVASAFLSAVMCVSMLMTPAVALADETSVPEETQTATEAETPDAQEEPEDEEEENEDLLPGEEDRKEALEAVASGKCGKKLKWSLDKKGTLKITGKGAMYNFDCKESTPYVYYSTAPWIKYASKIKKVVVSKKVTTLGAYSFYKCSNLSSVSLPKKMKAINDGAFAFCSKLTKITLPKKLTVINEGVFYDAGLTSVVIPKGVKSIRFFAFAGCDKLKSVSIPGTVKSIGVSAFGACSSLTTITIPASVKEIGDTAFSYCTNLKTVKIPISGLNTLGYSVFENCTALSTFEMPLSVTYVGEYIFNNCTSLSKVVISERQREVGVFFDKTFSGCKCSFDTTKYLIIGDYIPVGPVTYRITNPAINGTGTVDVYAISDSAESVVIPPVVEAEGVKYKVTTISGSLSQYNVDLKLKSLVIGSNVTSIGANAFSNCQYLESVTGGAGLKTIGAKAFENCPNLKVFTINSKVLSKIGAYAFNGDKALTTLQLKKTTKLTKAGVKNSLAGSSVKTVKVKKKKVKKYKKFFKKNNSGKSVKVKK